MTRADETAVIDDDDDDDDDDDGYGSRWRCATTDILVSKAFRTCNSIICLSLAILSMLREARVNIH